MRTIVWTTRPVPKSKVFPEGIPPERYVVEMSTDELQFLGRLTLRYKNLPASPERVAAWNQVHTFMEQKCHLDARLLDDVRAEQLARGELARDEAMHRVEDHADEGRKKEIMEAIRAVAQSRPDFQSDDVWMAMGVDKVTDEDAVFERRVMGPLLRWRAMKLGWIEPTDARRPAFREGNHKRPQLVWRSLLYEAGP